MTFGCHCDGFFNLWLDCCNTRFKQAQIGQPLLPGPYEQPHLVFLGSRKPLQAVEALNNPRFVSGSCKPVHEAMKSSGPLAEIFVLAAEEALWLQFMTRDLLDEIIGRKVRTLMQGKDHSLRRHIKLSSPALKCVAVHTYDPGLVELATEVPNRERHGFVCLDR